MKRLYVYVDASVIGGCEDSEFVEASLALWRLFVKGAFVQVLSAHTLRELQGAPDSVRSRLLEIPEANQLVLMDTPEAESRFTLRGRCWLMKTSFDAVAWMRARRAKIDEEDQGLSWAEKREKTRRLLETDPLWLRLRKRAVEPSSAPRMVVREPGPEYGTKAPD